MPPCIFPYIRIYYTGFALLQENPSCYLEIFILICFSSHYLHYDVCNCSIYGWYAANSYRCEKESAYCYPQWPDQRYCWRNNNNNLIYFLLLFLYLYLFLVLYLYLILYLYRLEIVDGRWRFQRLPDLLRRILVFQLFNQSFQKKSVFLKIAT